MDDKPWLDSSKISAFQLCPQRYAYRYEQHLVPFGGDEKYDTALAFGLAIHKALENFYDNSAFERMPCVCVGDAVVSCPFHDANRTTPKIIHTFLTAYPVDPDDPKDNRTRWNGALLLKAYISKWARETFTVEAIEVPFEIPFFEECQTCKGLIIDPPRVTCLACNNTRQIVTFKYVGRVDLFIRDTDGKLKPWDHKTAKYFGDGWLEQFKLSFQQTGYMLAAGQITGEDVFSGWINGLKTPLKTKAPDDDSFLRLETSRTPDDFALWERELREYNDRIREYRAKKFWPRSAPFACHAYNRRCPYYSLCTTHDPQRQTLIDNAYEKRPWNPHGEDDN